MNNDFNPKATISGNPLCFKMNYDITKSQISTMSVHCFQKTKFFLEITSFVPNNMFLTKIAKTEGGNKLSLSRLGWPQEGPGPIQMDPD